MWILQMEEMIAYRGEALWGKRKRAAFLEKKKCLSVNETAKYTGIGREKYES